MIRHVVLLHWKQSASPEAVQAVTDAFAKLPALIPEIRSYQFGSDLGIYDSNADYVVVADFDNEKDFKTYVTHADHGKLMMEVSMPIMESFNSAQFQL